MLTASNKDPNCSIATSLVCFNPLIKELVELQDMALGQHSFVGKRQHKVIRLGVANGFEMILERLPADGEAIFNDHFRFGFGEAIAFERIARIRQPNLEVVFERSNVVRLERPQDVEFGFEGIDLSFELRIHGDFFSQESLPVCSSSSSQLL